MDAPLSRKGKLRLLEIAREAIFYRLQRGSVPPFSVNEPELMQPAGAFVSLHLDGQLRGCIGNLHSDHPLHEVVAEMAVEAATGDPRFPSLSSKELPKTEIEISVLTPFVPLSPEEVVVGKHGLYMVRGPKRGVLLPQVAQQYGWTAEEFLQHTCRKAGLAPDAYLDKDTRIFGFEAEVFSNDSMHET
ncbi:MAG: AmmeMemoRadiSam system protein A [Myxococcota bacterium]